MKLTEDNGAKYIHFDVMDGMFVPSISFGMPVIKSIRDCSDRIFDVHLMIEEPGRYIDDLAEVGADLITVHAEACKHLDRTIEAIKEKGLLAGVALNPATPVETLSCVLDQVDMILLMSVNPGFGGQKFIPTSVDKIRRLKQMIRERDLKTDRSGRRGQWGNGQSLPGSRGRCAGGRILCVRSGGYAGSGSGLR